jgi:hypothetical protein
MLLILSKKKQDGKIKIKRAISLVGIVMVLIFTAQTYAQKQCDTPVIDSVEQTVDALGIGFASYGPGQTPAQLQIKDKKYNSGFGTAAKSDIIIELDGQYDAFNAEIGVQWQGGTTPASVVFQVVVDGAKKFESGVMRENDPAQSISVPLNGASILRLIVTDANDNVAGDKANWADCCVVKSKNPSLPLQTELFDVAPFAKVMTWEPNSIGSIPSRIQPLEQDQIFIGSDILSQADGTYIVPVVTNGQSCIGLQWLETRQLKKLAIKFAADSYIPSSQQTKVQQWVGESVWQGQWKTILGEIEKNQNCLTAVLTGEDRMSAYLGTTKIRWIFEPAEKQIRVAAMQAFTRSKWGTAEIKLELEKQIVGQQAHIGIYNGLIIQPDEKTSYNCSWNLTKPMLLKIRYCRSEQFAMKTDRTVINFKLPTCAFGISIEDIMKDGCVYVKDADLFITKAGSNLTFEEYKKQIADKKTVLQEVKAMPDQTFEQARQKLYGNKLNSFPTLTSLAADQHKLYVERNGTVGFNIIPDNPNILTGVLYNICQVKPIFGNGNMKNLTRNLHADWMPIPVTTVRQGDVVYRQTVFVAPYNKTYLKAAKPWLDRYPVGVIKFNIENTDSKPSDVSLKLDLLADARSNLGADVTKVETGFIAEKLGRLLLYIPTGNDSVLACQLNNNQLTIAGTVPAKTSAEYFVYIPFSDVGSKEYNFIKNEQSLLNETEKYWNGMMAETMQIDIPDKTLKNLILASQAYCMIAARYDDNDGSTFAMWDGVVHYGPLAGDSNYGILGLDLMGHHEFAQRCLDYFISRYKPQGYITTGYEIMGTGWHLWTVARHYQLTKDIQWLKQNASEFARVCDWVAEQAKKTEKLDAAGNKVIEYGLMPPGVEADWNAFAYYFCYNGYFYAGLDSVAEILKDVKQPQADLFKQQAAKLKTEILRAFYQTQAVSSVLPLRDGTYVSAYPSQVHCRSLTGDFFPGLDYTRSWCYDVEEGAHHLVSQGVLDPDCKTVTDMLNHLEDVYFLKDGWTFYPEVENLKDSFNFGGFSKVQPYLTRLAQIYALRDDVKPFIRGYFNAVASLFNAENLSLYEHFNGFGAWANSESMGHFLEQTHLMFVTERNGELWLAPFVTNNWLKDKMTVSIANAPTTFGPVGYTINSDVGNGLIQAYIDPPQRSKPKAIVIRLRHPDGKLIKKVFVDGESFKNFDTEKEIIRLKPFTKRLTLRVEY